MHDTESRIPQHSVLATQDELVLQEFHPGVPMHIGDVPTEDVEADAAEVAIRQVRHDKAVMLTDDQRIHVQAETAKRYVRRDVRLPEVTAAWEETVNLRRVLDTATRMFTVWADLDPAVLGWLSAREPKLHGYLMNAQEFTAAARQALQRAAGDVDGWMQAFHDLVTSGVAQGAWEYVHFATGALHDGPHTQAWDDAVEFFTASWEARAVELTPEPR